LYHWEINTIKSRLNAIPGVEATTLWQHDDISLEDCGILVKTDSVELELNLWDYQDWTALLKRVDGVIYTNKTGQYAVTRDGLAKAGIKIDGVADVVANLEEVLAACVKHNQKDLELKPWATRSWISLNSDLSLWYEVKPDLFRRKQEAAKGHLKKF
jgi:hypothetical protein